jgi:hypothetical protein
MSQESIGYFGTGALRPGVLGEEVPVVFGGYAEGCPGWDREGGIDGGRGECVGFDIVLVLVEEVVWAGDV